MTLYLPALLVMLALFLCACGDKGGPASAHAADVKLETVSGDAESVAFTIDLPQGYELKKPGGINIFGGARGQPRVRVAGTVPPPMLEAAVALAEKGVMAPRKVIFKEETEHGFVTVARNEHWTQIDGWTKDPEMSVHVWIELSKAAEDDPRIEWAKEVARSIRKK